MTVDHATEPERIVTLADLRQLHIRPLRRCEVAAVRDLYSRLSSRARYLRFFSVMPELPDTVLRLLACGDGRSRLAFVAEHRDVHGVDVVGLGSFSAIDGENAEVALVVRDDWQRQGVGTALARTVLQAGEARGFHRFVVHVLLENVGIRRLLNRVGDVLASSMSGGVVEIAFVHRRTG